MPLEVALAAVDGMLGDAAGRTLHARLSRASRWPTDRRCGPPPSAHGLAWSRGCKIGFSITTNGTLVTPDDAAFFDASASR
jgi:uncharacterized protein